MRVRELRALLATMDDDDVVFIAREDIPIHYLEEIDSVVRQTDHSLRESPCVTILRSHYFDGAIPKREDKDDATH